MSLQNLIKRTTTVAELADLLKQYPSDMPVMFGYNYRDYWQTEVASPIDQVDTSEVVFHGSSSMAKIVGYDYESDRHEDDEDDQPETVQVLILK